MSRYHGSAGRALTVLLAAAALALAPAIAAAAKPEVSTQRSHRRAPEWTVRAPETDDSYLYFVGRASGAATLEAAENDAAADVVRQIVSTIGLEAAFDYDRLRSEADLLLRDRLELTGESSIIGLKRLETYYEKTTIAEDNSVNNSWNAQVLARYPVESLNNETARLEQLSRSRVTTAEHLLAESRRMENAGLPDVAWHKLSEALELTATVGLVADPSTASRLAMVRQQLIDRARPLSFQLRRLTVTGPRSRGEEDGGQLMVQSLETALFRKGFRLERDTEAAAAGALPAVRIGLSEENNYQIEPGFYFSLWNAALSISAPGDGSVLFSDNFAVKGYGIDGERAKLDAMRKLRSEAFEQFAGRAWEYFDYKLAGEGVSDTPKVF